MIKKAFPFLLILAVSLYIVACQKDDSGQTEVTQTPPAYSGDFIVNDNVFVYEDELMVHAEVVDPSTIRIKSTMPGQYRPAIGNIILCPVGKRAPAGFLGRVERIEDDLYITSPAELEETFKELHIDEEIDLAGHVCGFEDEQGNGIEGAEIVEDTVWDGYDQKSDNASAGTKAGDWATLQTASWPFLIEGGVKGTLYVQSRLLAKIDIVNGKEIRRSFIIKRRSGIKIGMEYEWKEEKDYPLIATKGVLPPVNVAGILSVRPYWNYEAGFRVTGRAYVMGEITMEVENATYCIVLENGRYAFDAARNSGEQLFTVAQFEVEGAIGPYVKTGLELGFYDSRVVSVGVEADGALMAKVGTAFSLKDESLLVNNPTVKLQPELDIFIYVNTFLTSWWDNWTGDTLEMGGKRGRHITPSLPEFEMPLLPLFSESTYRRTDGTPSVKTELDTKSFMPAQEQGMAFYRFGKEQPVAEVPVEDDGSGDIAASFSGEANYARPYVKSSVGKVYYGEPIWSNRVTEVHYSGGTSYNLSYDGQGRLLKQTGYGNDVLQFIRTFSYSDNSISVSATEYSGGSPVFSIDTRMSLIDGRVVYEATGNDTKSITYYDDGHLRSDTSGSFLTWDTNGDLISMVYPSYMIGHTTTFSYFYTEYPNNFAEVPFDISTVFCCYSLYNFYGRRSNHLPYMISEDDGFETKVIKDNVTGDECASISFTQCYTFGYSFDDLGRLARINYTTVKETITYDGATSELTKSFSAGTPGSVTLAYE